MSQIYFGNRAVYYSLVCDAGSYTYTGLDADLTIITPARLITVNYNAPSIIVDYNTINIEVDA